MLDTVAADLIARGVNARFHEMLDEARERGKLGVLAYSQKKNEKWMVFEVFWRLMRDWGAILGGAPQVTQAERDVWDWHLEIGYPSGQGADNSKCRFDIGYGPAVENHNAVWFATPDTVVFQAKMVRRFKLLEAHPSIAADVMQLRAEGMRNGYVMVLWVTYPEYKGRSVGHAWDDDAHMLQQAADLTAALTTAVPALQPVNDDPAVCAPWGPFRLPLVQDWGATNDNCVFAQMYRVRLDD